ncbi:TetR/AcrR family transcriptional regulator, partial [Stenotrophomonas pictorum]|uniref:TetR/AcrR family transcriptional regulator n=1 Tax=Stenotrophomonas pictorum TaxID=86184 RepID=UPI000A4D28F1
MSQAQRHARPLNRSESQVRTRAALLDAAEALIVEHSIPALSLRAVCTRAGYTQGAFYSNFADREELLLEVMERNLEQKAASLEQMLATAATQVSTAPWRASWIGWTPSTIGANGRASPW